VTTDRDDGNDPKPTDGVPRPQRGSRSRGEQTRQQILDAVMKVIARDGVRGVTHRAVATEAGVNLSLTTYYFVDRYDLVACAFRAFVDRVHAELEGGWDGVFRHLEKLRQSRRGAAGRAAMRDYVTERIVEYVARKIEENPLGLAVEHHFFFEALLDPRLVDLAAEHRTRLVAPLVRLCEFFGSDDPHLDADLLFGTIIRIEYEALLEPGARSRRRRLRASVRRVVGWIASAS
jgi:DNA-binding transcriptional regulator YbjK